MMDWGNILTTVIIPMMAGLYYLISQNKKDTEVKLEKINFKLNSIRNWIDHNKILYRKDDVVKVPTINDEINDLKDMLKRLNKTERESKNVQTKNQ